ncbi:tyrosine-protein phosphatase non-receptor type substrate 1-like [Channa argus]|uniref:tyrosine-protein phosphatase non-receptor type substrate 1-like n=1 Tax=Channa argus TaxID=215402 RepID=UPI00352214D6
MRQRRTMAEFRRILMVLFLILMIHFTARTNGQYSSVITRSGDNVTLPCEIGDKCDEIHWLFSGSEPTRVVVVFRYGEIDKTQISKSKSDRLSVAENCSLVIKKVTVEDVGHYGCQLLKSQKKQISSVHLSVVTMTEETDGDTVQLSCSVWDCGPCRHTVKWLFDGKDVSDSDKDLKTSQSGCYTTVSFLDSHLISSSRFELFQCEVTDDTGTSRPFPFSPQSSEDKTGWRWWIVFVSVGFSSPVIIVIVTVNRCKSRKGQKTQMNENTTDPEDEVSYASISFTKKTNSKVQVQKKDEGDDDDDAVTYNILYSTINTPN